MMQTVEVPLWLFLLIVLFATITFASHFLFPSVRWFFRHRLERAVERLNRRLERPIQPFKLARRYDMIQRLIYDPQVAQGVADHARAQGVPENVAFEEARRYAREIVPSFSAVAYFSIAIRLARFLSNAIYRVRLGHMDEAAIEAIDPDATVVFVMNHRSNMDYVLITYLVADRSALSYAVGEWARVWPLSRLIRAMGAYFIRRKSRNDLYRRVLATYVRLATQGGVTQAIFPEGGLSLDGALAEPKIGLLKYIVDGQVAQEEDGRDVVFVPVALNYDRVLEDNVLTSAAKSGDRRFRARIHVVAIRLLRQLLLLVTGRYHRFGYAAVSFGRPLSLQDFRSQKGGRDTPTVLAQELMGRIGECVPVLPVSLLAAAMTGVLEGANPLSRSEIKQAMDGLLEQIPYAYIHTPHESREYAAEVALRELVTRGVLQERDGHFQIAPKQRDLLIFYANAIRHLIPDPLGKDPESARNAARAK
ncbi:1-acyl-sn-glycerol-3-phosphate acyltransferase [Phaeobacter sp. C3_T13_0]|uniref:1-acyl-sn-glycerol-3-phosphate acyltransferase n=1 Tax=Phaeobacter cretensis TaxID=3342641 RepID=UPI0039BC5C01